MSCLIKAMKMGIIDEGGKQLKGKDFPDAFKLIKYYMPFSLIEVYDAWRSKLSRKYESALISSAVLLLDKKGLDMDAILYELNRLPTDGSALEMYRLIKQEWNLWEQLDEELDDAEFDYVISIHKIHLNLLEVESIEALVSILDKCELVDCTADDIAKCVNNELFINDIMNSDYSNNELAAAIGEISKYTNNNYTNLNYIIDEIKICIQEKNKIVD